MFCNVKNSCAIFQVRSRPRRESSCPVNYWCCERPIFWWEIGAKLHQTEQKAGLGQMCYSLFIHHAAKRAKQSPALALKQGVSIQCVPNCTERCNFHDAYLHRMIRSADWCPRTASKWMMMQTLTLELLNRSGYSLYILRCVSICRFSFRFPISLLKMSKLGKTWGPAEGMSIPALPWL